MVYQGACPPSIHQGGIEKFAAGSKNERHVIVDTPLLEETTSHRGRASKSRLSNTESRICKWSEDDYVAVMRAYYEAKHHPKAGRTLELPAQQDVIRAREPSRKPQYAVSISELLRHSRLLAQIFNVLNNFRHE